MQNIWSQMVDNNYPRTADVQTLPLHDRDAAKGKAMSAADTSAKCFQETERLPANPLSGTGAGE